MTNKELRKLTREDLLELLLEQAEADEKRRGETDRLTALNQSLESEKDRLTQELDACRADLEKVGQTADALKEELAGAKEAAVETETLRAEIDHLREENDSLRQELECLHQEGWQSSEKDRQFERQTILRRPRRGRQTLPEACRGAGTGKRQTARNHPRVTRG